MMNRICIICAFFVLGATNTTSNFTIYSANKTHDINLTSPFMTSHSAATVTTIDDGNNDTNLVSILTIITCGLVVAVIVLAMIVVYVCWKKQDNQVSIATSAVRKHQSKYNTSTAAVIVNGHGPMEEVMMTMVLMSSLKTTTTSTSHSQHQNLNICMLIRIV